MGKDLLLVGSMPFDTAEQTFRWACEGGLAPSLPCLPDGEVGERSYWIIVLGYRVYHGHPEIETPRRPAPRSRNRTVPCAGHHRSRLGRVLPPPPLCRRCLTG